MIDQIFVSVKAHLAVTLIAPVALLFIMSILVLHLIAFGIEASSAVDAFELLLTCVRPLMQLQICQVLICLSTNILSIDEGGILIGKAIS